MNKLVLAMAGVLATSSLAHAGKKQDLEDVVSAARALRPYDDRSDVNMQSRWVTRGIAQVKNCFKAIDAAVKAGATLTEEFAGDRGIPHLRQERGPRGGWTATTNLGLLKKYCKIKRAKVQLARAYLAMNAAFHQNNRIGRAKTVYDIKYALAKQRACAVQVKRALKTKYNERSITIQRPDTTLGQAQTKVCGALATAIEAARKRIVAKTDLSGFTALEGDRLKVLNDNLLFDGDTFGSDKFPLKDPDDFAYSDVWYEVSKSVNELSEERWTVRIYTFKEATLVSTTIKRGQGEAPPASLFK